ncbi:hypothetical protein [Neptunicella sp.]
MAFAEDMVNTLQLQAIKSDRLYMTGRMFRQSTLKMTTGNR